MGADVIARRGSRKDEKATLQENVLVNWYSGNKVAVGTYSAVVLAVGSAGDGAAGVNLEVGVGNASQESRDGSESSSAEEHFE